MFIHLTLPSPEGEGICFIPFLLPGEGPGDDVRMFAVRWITHIIPLYYSMKV
jgi:hypothetical protein